MGEELKHFKLRVFHRRCSHPDASPSLQSREQPCLLMSVVFAFFVRPRNLHNDTSLQRWTRDSQSNQP